MAQFRCSRCGATFDNIPRFCPHCGAVLSNGNDQEEVIDLFPVDEKGKKEKKNSKYEVTPEELKEQKRWVIFGFILAIFALICLGGTFADVYIIRSFDMTVRIAMLPALPLLAWISAGVGNLFLNKGDDVKGGFLVMKIFGKIFAIISLWIAVLATIAAVVVVTIYFASQWISSFVDLDMKAIIEEFLRTGRIPEIA